ncbi:ABC transporter ATP-binding protein [Ramlibacter solisilvae]|uniref:ABC transporter ATP-binding protein n=1 Tax=Ramlibacter tataouinensis TaxID=94132 RepID=UPI00077765D2|nr:ABC transporter ATP-binding protein [Ramlibacter tataouinensis]
MNNPSSDPSDALLTIRNLRVEFDTRRGTATALRGVDIEVRPGEVLGLVGESGSGKSVTGLAAMRLLGGRAKVQAEMLAFGGEDLLTASEERMRSLRGSRMAMVFQDPAMTLNPVLRIDTQMMEAITAHDRVSAAEAWDRCCAALAKVGIAEPAKRMKSYPHEFSGGMRQRVAIAIALLHRPALIIADEPTTALDVTIQAQILYEVERLCRETKTALLWVTHDLGVVERIADRVAVMYAGRIVEQGPAQLLLRAPRHPYTAGLRASMPHRQVRGQSLVTMPPSGKIPTQGCSFAPRCSRARADCTSMEPAQLLVGNDHVASCLHPLSAGDIHDPPA